MRFLALIFCLFLWRAAAQQALNDPSALADAGAKLLEARQIAEGKKLLERAIELDPNHSKALLHLGLLYYSLDQLILAESYLKQASDSDPHSFQARFLLGASLVQLGKNKEAIQELRAAHRLNSKHPDVVKLLAIEYLEGNYFNDAVELLVPLVDSRTSDEELLLLLIESYQKSGDTGSSFQLTLKSVQRFPGSARSHCWLGAHLQFVGRYAEAKRMLQKAIHLDPTLQVSYYLLADVFLKEQKYTEAIEYFGRAIEKDPGDLDARLGFSRALQGVNEISKALDELETAAELAPGDWRVHLRMSRLHFRMGDEVLAKKEADLSLQLRKRNPAVLEIPAGLSFGSGGRN